MKIYLVGGAVKNKLLGLPINDRDWVVVGATPNDLIKLGFKQVGKFFPVFIHPKTNEEYALARIERKTGVGYHGFSCYSSPDITIENDLLRRDLTINAIAQTIDGKIIDPYNGLKDIKNRLLRHVSEAFIEDPLRILRIARFAAQLANKNFSIANETYFLMKKIVNSNELTKLSSERIWMETKKALETDSPECYFYVLRNCGALSILFPEINHLFEILISKKMNINKINLGIHTLLSLKIAASLTKDVETRFAVLCHNIDNNMLLSKQHINLNSNINQVNSLIQNMCNRLHVPNKIQKTAQLIACTHPYIYNLYKFTSEEIILLFNKLDIWRKPNHITQLIITCEADSKAWFGEEYNTYQQNKFLITAFKQVEHILIKNIIQNGMKGEIIRNKINHHRIQILNDWKKKHKIF